MTIVIGASKAAKEFIENYGNNDGIVCYDNDRRKWGKSFAGIQIISLNEYLEILKLQRCKIIVAISNKTILYFLKDTCADKHDAYILKDKELVKLDFDNLIDYGKVLEIAEVEKIKRYKDIIASGQIKSEFALEHYKKYIRHRENDNSWPEINSVELTNYCNLKCPNCPTPTCKRPKGFMSKEVFDKAMEYVTPDMDSYFSLHGLGEPLLHPHFLECVRRVAELEKPIFISTNGILFNRQKADELLEVLADANKSKLYISFHKKESVENWKYAVELLKKKKIKNVALFGQILEHNEKEAIGWLSEMGVSDPFDNEYIRYVTSHSFAGSVQGRRTCYSDVEVKNRFRNCYYVKNNCTAVAWDGRLKICCLDSELEGIGGTVFNVEKLTHKNTPYRICHYCDPDWTSNYQ